MLSLIWICLYFQETFAEITFEHGSHYYEALEFARLSYFKALDACRSDDAHPNSYLLFTSDQDETNSVAFSLKGVDRRLGKLL